MCAVTLHRLGLAASVVGMPKVSCVKWKGRVWERVFSGRIQSFAWVEFGFGRGTMRPAFQVFGHCVGSWVWRFAADTLELQMVSHLTDVGFCVSEVCKHNLIH